jgi:hypothetical protein
VSEAGATSFHAGVGLTYSSIMKAAFVVDGPRRMPREVPPPPGSPLVAWVKWLTRRFVVRPFEDARKLWYAQRLATMIGGRALLDAEKGGTDQKTPPERGFQSVGAPRFELGTSSPPGLSSGRAASVGDAGRKVTLGPPCPGPSGIRLGGTAWPPRGNLTSNRSCLKTPHL